MLTPVVQERIEASVPAYLQPEAIALVRSIGSKDVIQTTYREGEAAQALVAAGVFEKMSASVRTYRQVL